MLPLADVVTPNIPEAEEITGIKIDSEANIYKAGNIFINDIGSKGVVIKGGHSEDPNIAKDYLFTKMMFIHLKINVLTLRIRMVRAVHFLLLSLQN